MTPHETPALQAQQLGLMHDDWSLRGAWRLQDITLHFPAGAVVGLLGLVGRNNRPGRPCSPAIATPRE
jgi:hypothetical protein